ncbi:RNA polymerase III subunit GL b isoform X1 [Carcharodon carcharias]|uniref:RNA polymerase III subunit GL b isoform X1 n=1 Tax=Carcharodon carcharias TaxID=13397 RepID=UPI001B7E4FA1|nr:RNA polymerase III subunit GL b isoform X1 [Carcharodon carcharias]
MMMSGRARPQAPISLNVEAIGIGKGETLPPPTLQPAPLYPSLEFKAVPLHAGEEAEYMLALKQELRGAMRSLPYYVKPAAPKKDIERYSDKYQSSGPTDNTIEWNPDWRRLPRELKIRIRKPAKDKIPVAGRKIKPRTSVEKEEIIKKLETLEKKEEAHSSDEEDEQEKEEEEKENEEEYDEEEFEEETDYVMSYFDNGEEFGGDSDENMDEAIY